MQKWIDAEHKFKYPINILRDDKMTKGKKLNVHCHDFIEMEYVLSGSGCQVINGVEYQVNRGDLICINKGDWHTYYTEDKMCIINVIFYDSVYEEMLDMIKSYMVDVKKMPKISHLQGKDILEIEKLLLSAENEFLEDKIGCYVSLKSYLVILFINLFRISIQKETTIDKKAVAILDFIDNNFTDISIEKVINRFGYTKSYFSKYFKKNFGVTFINYVTAKRVYRAAELLVLSEESVDFISEEIGIKDKKHFYKVFESYFGMTPAKYRKDAKQKNITIKEREE